MTIPVVCIQFRACDGGGHVLLGPQVAVDWEDEWGGKHRCAAGKLKSWRRGAAREVCRIRIAPDELFRMVRSIESFRHRVPAWLSFRRMREQEKREARP